MPEYAIFLKGRCLGWINKARNESNARIQYASTHDLSPLELMAIETRLSQAKRAYLEATLEKYAIKLCLSDNDYEEALYKLQHEEDFWKMNDSVLKSYLIDYEGESP